MSDDKKEVNAEAEQTNEQQQVVVPAGLQLEQQLTHLQAVNKEAFQTRDAAKRKLKELEKAHEDLVAKASKLEATLRNKVADGYLREALQAAGVTSLGTALKIVDFAQVKIDEEYKVDQESVKALVEQLKTSDPVLFQPVKSAPATPIVDVKRPADGEQKSLFEQEITAAKTQKQIEAVMRKFGKI